MLTTITKWEYAQIRAMSLEDKDIVISINGQIQDFRNHAAHPFDILNQMGEEGWELVTVLDVIPPSQNSLNPRCVREYLLKRMRAGS
jgi:hypothetical protein